MEDAAHYDRWRPGYAPEVGYPKALRLLKPGGVLALFWNHPFAARADEPLHQAVQKVCGKYRPSPRPPVEFGPEDYIALLNTYSDHRAMPGPDKAPFEAELAETIRRFGGSIPIYDTMDLYLGRKPCHTRGAGAPE